MTNAEIARVFEQIADLLEIRGEKSFRVNAHRRVARTIDDYTGDVAALAREGRLTELPDVGKSSAEKIAALVETGQSETLAELAEEVPLSLLELLRIPHLGPKKVALLWRERGIETLDDLESALDSDALKDIKGFGAKTLDNLREGLEFLRQHAGRSRIGEVASLADALVEDVRGLAGVRRVEHAGSLRRGKETIGDLDLLCISDNPAETVQAFTKLDGAQRVLAAGEKKGSVLFERGGGARIQVDLRVVAEAEWGAAWLYFTGSKEHNVRLRERALKRDLTLNEYALREEQSERVVASRTEEDIYAALDLPWIPPALREDRGEFKQRALPKLIERDDIRGELHMHTTASDGHASIEEMAEAAKARGYEYICITDHSVSSTIANGLSEDRLRSHIDQIRAANDAVGGIEILAGSEVDIRLDGTLDYPDSLLEQLDFVVASVHAGLGKDKRTNTRRTLNAIANPYVNCIAHPTGRMINSRAAMELELDAIVEAAAETGTALEVNANHHRLDLKDTHVRMALEAGVTLSINCDAHRPTGFEQMRFGILTAQRGWARAEDVLNTRSLGDVRAFVRAKRERLG